MRSFVSLWHPPRTNCLPLPLCSRPNPRCAVSVFPSAVLLIVYVLVPLGLYLRRQRIDNPYRRRRRERRHNITALFKKCRLCISVRTQNVGTIAIVHPNFLLLFQHVCVYVYVSLSRKPTRLIGVYHTDERGRHRHTRLTLYLRRPFSPFRHTEITGRGGISRQVPATAQSHIALPLSPIEARQQVQQLIPFICSSIHSGSRRYPIASSYAPPTSIWNRFASKSRRK